jgi:hypothetical protein
VTVPRVVDGGTIPFELIPAGEEREERMSREESDQFRQEHAGSGVVPLAFSFTDSSSALWERSQDGRLTGGRQYRWPR